MLINYNIVCLSDGLYVGDIYECLHGKGNLHCSSDLEALVINGPVKSGKVTGR